MDGLLTDLLTYARIGTHVEAEEARDVAPLVRDTVQLCAIPEGFQVCVADDLPRITANPTEFSLVIRNLVTNAVKHHDREAGRIEIGAERDGDRVRFHLSDDGPGVLLTGDQIPELFSYLSSPVRLLLDPQHRFKKQGIPDSRYYHGGALPQECILSFLKIEAA